MISIDQSLKRLAEISSLRDGWLHDDSVAISQDSISLAQKMIVTFTMNDRKMVLVQPGIFPSLDAGISIEFDMPFVTVDLNIHPNGKEFSMIYTEYIGKSGSGPFTVNEESALVVKEPQQSEESFNTIFTMDDLDEISRKLIFFQERH